MATASPSSEEYHVTHEEDLFLQVLQRLGVEASTRAAVKQRFLASDRADTADRYAPRLSPVVADVWARVKRGGLSLDSLTSDEWAESRQRLVDEHRRLADEDEELPDLGLASSVDDNEEEDAAHTPTRRARGETAGSDLGSTPASAAETVAPPAAREVAFDPSHYLSSLERFARAAGIDLPGDASSAAGAAGPSEAAARAHSLAKAQVREIEALGPDAARLMLGVDTVRVAEQAPPPALPRELINALPPATNDPHISFDALLDNAANLLARRKKSIGLEAKELVQHYNAEASSKFKLLDAETKKRVQNLNSRAALARQALLRETQMCISLAKTVALFDGPRHVSSPAESTSAKAHTLDIQPLRDLLLHSTFQYAAILAEIREAFDSLTTVPAPAKAKPGNSGTRAELSSKERQEAQHRNAERTWLLYGQQLQSKARPPQQERARDKPASSSKRGNNRGGGQQRGSRSRSREQQRGDAPRRPRSNSAGPRPPSTDKPAGRDKNFPNGAQRAAKE